MIETSYAAEQSLVLILSIWHVVFCRRGDRVEVADGRWRA